MRITCVSYVLDTEIQVRSKLWVDNFEIEEESLTTEEDIETIELNIYPNPATSYINYETPINVSDIVVYVIDGREMDVQIDTNKKSINIEKLTKGKYIIAFESQGKIIRRFFVKQ